MKLSIQLVEVTWIRKGEQNLMSSPSLRLLFLNQYFPPDTSATANVAQKVVAMLAQKQHHVTVLAGRPSYNPLQTHPYYLWQREIEGNVIVERVGSTAYFRGRMRHRMLNYLTYLVLALPRALTLSTDMVISMTDPPLVGVVAALVAWIKRKPFVYFIQDLHPDMVLCSGMVKPAPWVHVWEQLHRWVLRRATQIIVLGDDMRARVIAKGINPARIAVVRTGTSIPDKTPAENDPIVQEIRQGFDFVVLHAGNLGFYGDWETLIEAMNHLQEERIGLLFIGEGATKSKLQLLAQGNRQIRFMPFCPAEQVAQVLAAADLHVVTIRPGTEGVIVPSKLYPILAAGRPVLAVVPATSDAAQIVTQYNCGVVVDPGNSAAVAAAIQNCYQNPEQVKQMGQQARAIAPIFETGKQLAILLQLIENAAAVNS
jgi:glycosyltransferase involved in cell wall biosynthesis